MGKRTFWSVHTALLIFCVSLGCEKASKPVTRQGDGDTQKGGDTLIISPRPRGSFFRQLDSLHLGDGFVEVVAKLGKPDLSTDIGGKRYDDPGFHVVIYYFVKIPPSNSANSNDQEVALWFDWDNRLVLIGSNVEGHSIERGSLPPELRRR